MKDTQQVFRPESRKLGIALNTDQSYQLSSNKLVNCLKLTNNLKIQFYWFVHLQWQVICTILPKIKTEYTWSHQADYHCQYSAYLSTNCAKKGVSIRRFHVWKNQIKPFWLLQFDIVYWVIRVRWLYYSVDVALNPCHLLIEHTQMYATCEHPILLRI